MKLNFTVNKRENESKLQTVLDFFLWSSLPQKIQQLFRKYRLRFESGVYGEKEIGIPFKVLLREFGTFRAFFWTCFYLAKRSIEEFFKRLLVLGEVLVFEPQLEFIGGIKQPIGYLFAIALDNSTNSGNKENEDPWTWSHTCTGSNLALVASVQWWDNSGAVNIGTGTYNTTETMTNQVHQNENGYVYNADIFTLVNPSTGAHTVSIDFTAASYGRAGTQSFSGTNTSSLIDVKGSAQGTGTVPTKSLTTTNANSFLIDCLTANQGNPATITVGTGQTQAWQGSRKGAASRKATTTAGSYTMYWTLSGSGKWGLAVVAINEAPAAGPAQLKSWNGLGKASMKTVNGLAIGSIKSWNGLG